MSAADLPFNLDLLTPTLDQLKSLRPIRSLDIFESSTKNFHPEGLFSVETFGKVGTENRNRSFGYIDIIAPILHPVIYKALAELKELYGDIMNQTKYALWNEKLKDFEVASAIDGETGMAFFLQHYKEIKFLDRKSVKRSFNIELIEKFKDRSLIQYILVLPAGLRDYEIGDSGKPEEGEVNTFYRSLLSLANLITPAVFKNDPRGVDSTRHRLQLTMIEIYNYYRGLIEGKSKFIQSKWAARKIFNSTRNVASTIINEATTADDINIIKANETAVGLHQYARSTAPMSLHHLRETFLHKVFTGANTPAILVNAKTLKKEMVNISADHYDEWMSSEGLDNVIARFGERELRHEPLMLDKHYLGLIYKGPDMTYRFLQDIDDLPEAEMAKYVTPITFCELLYLSLYKDSHTVPGFVTRYPITGYGSIYPSLSHLKTTMPFEVRTELDDNWQPTDSIAKNFPIAGASFFDTLAPNLCHLGRLGLDFDGDVISYICVVSEEAKAEVHRKMASASYYVDANGKMYFSAGTETIGYVLGYLTGS